MSEHRITLLPGIHEYVRFLYKLTKGKQEYYTTITISIKHAQFLELNLKDKLSALLIVFRNARKEMTNEMQRLLNRSSL
jgi:hypothetical protein